MRCSLVSGFLSLQSSHRSYRRRHTVTVMASRGDGADATPAPRAGGRPARRKLYSYEEARRIARGHGFQSREEFVEYECAGAYQLPKDADVVWKDDWTSWEDFLGVTLTFEAGREVARTMEVATEEDYMRLMKSKTIPEEDVASRLPFRPDLMYKENWNGWDDFLVGDAS
ncbi:hypothetical protein THAOC_04654 [Thalassiosira oceanica]|uniref:Uncharacterized protein n=1 Tax=Thalassiosira oceanica TaxID=159749 RepID=K0TIU9_THAOC|nr:hypothetical protein THAOC_04654 [Thalassiosira oceanica]|eukprot:EJK73706.1 hypothetical protein THAOC_04654 [Thalassiosira oceanica]